MFDTTSSPSGKWTERPSAVPLAFGDNETMFRLLFERSADAIWLFDPQTGRFVDCNQAAVELLRAGKKEILLNLRPEDLSPPVQPDGRTSSEKAIEVVQSTERLGGHRFEWVAQRFDGENVPLEVLSTPITANGRTLHVVVSRDITQRKRAEAALRESQQLLASISDNISEAIYRTGPNHELIFANPAYLRMSGYNSVEEMRRVPREKLYGKSGDRARLLELLALQGSFRNEEIEYVRHDGQRWWGLTNSVAIRDPQTREVLYHVGSVADITERKQAQEKVLQLNISLERRIIERTAELTASEARLRTLVDHAPEAIVVFDGDTGGFLFGNAHACSIFGRCGEDLSKLSPKDVSPEFQPNGQRSVDLAREKMREALAGGTPVFEWLHRHSTGKLIPTEVRLVRLPGDSKNLVRASIIDNTDRRRREQVQQATYEISEAVHTTEDLGSFFRQIHAIVKGLMPAENLYIALADPAGQTITFPYLVDEHDLSTAPLPAGKGLTGYVLSTGKALLAGPHNAAVPGAGVQVVIEDDQQVVAEPCGLTALVWLGAPLAIRGQTFGVVAVQDYHNPLAYGESDKQILTFVAGQIALAIERKRAEQALRESEEKFRALFAASSQGVLLQDQERYLEVNPAAVRILGYNSPADLVGCHPLDTSPPLQPNGQSSDALARQYITECMVKGRARFEWIARSPRGQDIPLEVILTRIEWGGRQIIQAVINDISERKKAEAELLKALAREKELGQLKSNFVSMVSHEFRTPLGVIMSSAEILDAYFDQLEPLDRREQLQSIQKNTRRMANLMEEVLLLGMVEAGKMDFSPAPADLTSFCRQLVDELLSATDRKCPVHFSALSIPEDAMTDTRLLRHILTNLLSNAVKYSPANSPVDLQVYRDGGQAVCRIRDRGMGIPEQDREWLFNAFHRGHNVSHVPGTGLGLTIVKRCVELHGGHIHIDSTVGQGTIVTVRLPMFVEHA
jgi:PAS domain S-box-containing protein